MRDGRVAIIVADVVGHGVSAAMLMAKLSAETRFALASISPTNAAISTLNANISGLGVDKFITFLCLVLDPKSGKIEIVNAGHMAPLWRRVNTTVDQPGEEASGVPLGIMDDYEYDLATIELGPGERLVLYTDGINEAPNAEGACFGIQPMLDVLATTSTDVQHIGNRIIEDVTKYIEGTTQADDMCLLVIGRR
ncbi:MAG: PP2C family protein-serine/threonine phosphatase [Pirellulales bacterium]